MIFVVDDAMSREIEQHGLVMSCERCAYFEPKSGSCSHGYPNEEHRLETIRARRLLVFCKEFELA